MKGTYTLTLYCRKTILVKFGSLGSARLKKGYYVYTGSALGSGSTGLFNRLRRHLSPEKKVRWHIDYLTVNPRIKLTSIVCLRSKRRLECAVNNRLRRALHLSIILPHLGATDCNCGAHLLRVENRADVSLIRRIITNVYENFGEPEKALTHVEEEFRSIGLRPISS